MPITGLWTRSDRLRFVLQAVFIIFFLVGQNAWTSQLVVAAPSERPRLSVPPSISLNVPASAFIGTNVSFTVTFDNPHPTGVGYGPVIDLIIPRNGADGNQNTNPPLDGLTFVSATYLGTPVEHMLLTFPGSGGVTCVPHPYIVDNTGTPVQVCGNAGDQFLALRLPFGSFTPTQPPLVVNVAVSMSNLADLGTPLTIQARGGYQFGYDPLNNYTTDNPAATLSAWTSAGVTPTLFTLSKSYNGPEDETATGLNFPRRYTVTATIAPGQTMSPFTLTDTLPSNMQFLSLVGTSPAATSCTLPSTTTSGGTLSCTFASVSGTVTMTFEYYIPLRDAGGASVINPATGDDALSCNNASGGGTWTPIDPRDTGSTFTQNLPGCEHTLQDKSIAIQKTVSVVGGGGPAPGRYLEYTLDFQISDFFVFDNVQITDVISDGQHFAPDFVPTLQLNGNTYTLSALAMQASNVTTSCNYTGAIASPPAPPGECDQLDPAANDGTTTIVFNISQEIRDRLGIGDGRLIGGCVPLGGTGGSDPTCSGYNDGPTTGRIVFRTLIQQNFTDTYPSGDPSIDQGDTLNNTVTIQGDLLSTANASTPTGYSEADGSGASVAIERGPLTKSVYAVNGNTSFGTPVEVKPGDTVTYRLTYILPTGDVEDMEFDDYLPLPVFHVDDPDEDGAPGPSWAFVPTVSAAAPPPGQAKFGPSDTFYAYSGIVPTITSNATNNRLNFLYGDFDGPTEQTYVVDILFTATVSDDPFADRLYLTNQAHAFEGSTNAGTADANAIVQIILTQPVLTVKKGIIWTDNSVATFTPHPAGPVTFLPPSNNPRWSGVINSTNLASTPINSNLSGVDAGDIVTFAIAIENTGSSGNGAFDIRVRDDLPAGFVIPGGGLNLQVHRGDGTPLTYTDLGGGLFGTGIEINDFTSPVQGAAGPHHATNGQNIVVVTFDLQVASTVQGGQIFPNTATLFHYAGSEGGPDHTSVDLTDQAITQIRYDGVGKTFTTEIVNSHNTLTQAVIGEYVDYTITLTFHEGVTPNVTLQDELPSGMAFVDCLSITPSSSDLTTDLPGGFSAACNDPTNPNVSPPAQDFTFTLGTITNANTNNAVDETLTIVFRAVVLNVMGNQSGTNLVNRATLLINGGAGGTAVVQSAPVTVIEPTVNTAKSASPTMADAGDTIAFTVTLSNPASGSTTAYDVSWSDTLPTGLNYVPGSLSLGACAVATPPTLNDGAPPTLTASGGVFHPGQSCTITFQATVDSSVTPDQTFINVAQTRWTSIPGPRVDFSPYHPASDERDGSDGLLGSGALNDYRTQGQVSISIYDPQLAKSLSDTELNTLYNGANQTVIGELITYTVTLTIPEGVTPNAQLVDTLDSGLAFVALDSAVLSPGLTISGSTTPTISSGGQVVTFNFGNITNSNTDNSVPETITLTYRVVVLNILANQAGTLLNNAVQFTWTGGSASASAPNVTVIEPTVNTAKSASPTTADAGDTIAFTVTLSNPASGSTTAYDVSWSDTLPTGLNYVPGSLSLGTCAVATPPTLNDGAPPTLTASGGVFHPGQSCVITFQAIVDYSVSPGQVITNVAQTQWTSIPGSPGQRSSYNVNSTERDGTGGLLGSGALNDYRTQGQVSVTIAQVAPQKSIVATSEAHTGAVMGTERVAIGEIIRYRLVVRWPEGTSPNAMLRDNLPVGLQFLDTDPPSNTRVAFVCNSGPACMSSSTLGSAPVINGNETTVGSITPTYILPDAAVSASENIDDDSYGSGTDPYFKFGHLSNNDNDADQEFVVLEFNALVLNINTNQSGTGLGNWFVVRINGSNAGSQSNTVSAVVAEPALSLTKVILSPAPSDAGDTFTYRLVITNTSSGNNAATAFDLVLTDVLDPYLNINSVTLSTTQPSSCNGGHTFNANYSWSGTPTTVTVTANCLDPGRSLTADISVTVASNTPARYTIPNTGNLTYTSLPGTGTVSNPTGGTTPGASGASNGERNGQDGVGGALNDYAATASINRILAAPSISKGAPTPTTYSIGEIVTYPIIITLPEGVTRNVRVLDAIPNGMQYVGFSVNTSAFNGSVPTPTVNGEAFDGDDVTFTFGDINTTDDNVTTNNSFTLNVLVRVLNVSSNVDGTTLTNSASLTYWPGTGTTDTTISGGTRTITVVEPRIATTKSVSPTSGVDAGDIVTYSIQFTNTGNSTAYDVTAEDILAQGVTYNNDASCSFFNGSMIVPIPVSVTVGAGTLTFDGNPPGSWDIPATNPDSYIVCTYTVTAQSSLHLDGAHTNTVDADWSSLNGTDANERLYNDTGTSPFDGTQDTASAIFNSPAPTFDKNDATTNLPIGATYTVNLILTSPLGTLRNLTISDTLPAGLFYVTGTQSVSSGISPAPTFSVSGPNDGSAPTTLTWTFGDAVVSSSPVIISYQVTVANLASNQNGVTRTNSATLSYRDAQNNLKTLTDTDTITIVEPELDITKTVDDATPAYGQTLTYTLTVSHLPTSTATAYDILVTDTIPSGLTYVPGSISAPAGWVADDSVAPNLSWTCSAPCSLPVGNTAALSYQVTVNGPPGPPHPGDTLTNSVVMIWTSTDSVNSNERTGSGGINDYRDTASRPVTLTYPDLTVTKTDGQSTYIPGNPLTYTIVVSNVGNGNAINATVNDPIPTQITSWSWTCTPGSGASCNGSGGYISTAFSDIVTIPAGSSITYTVVVQTDPAATTDLTNTVSVSLPAGMPDPTPANNTASDTDTPDRRADLSITKDDSVAQYVPGGTLTYTIIVSNAGPSNAPNALVTDSIPAHFISWTWTCSGSTGGASGCDPYTGNGNFSDMVNLPAGSSITYTVVANIASSATGDLTNIATVQPPSGVTDPTPGNNSATDTDTQNSQAAISVTKDDGVAQYTPGATLTYTITVTNTGPSDALGVSVSDSIPAHFSSWTWTCVGSSGGASGCTPYSGSGDFSDSINLAGPFPSSITYQVVAQVRSSATGDLTNTVTISHPADTTPGDNTASDTDTPNYQADLYVTKTDGSATYTPGLSVVYTVMIGNSGPSDVTGAVVTDNLPAQATSWTWSCSGSTGGASGCTPYSGSGNFSDTVNLPAGSTITYTVEVVIPSSATGDLVNTASIDPPSGVSDPDLSDNSATDTDTQNSQAAISVTKDDGVAQYTPGATLTYTITVTNTGPSDALGVSVSDSIPAHFSSWTWTCVGSSGGASGCTPYSGSGDFSDSINLAGPFSSSITYQVVAQVRSSATGDLTNTVTISHPADTTPGDNTASDTDTPNYQADLSVTKDDGVTVVSPGTTITYTVEVHNDGPSDVIGAIVSDARPPQIASWTWICFSQDHGANGCDGYGPGNGNFSDTVNLPAGASITYLVTAQIDVTASGTLTNTVTVSVPVGVTDPTPENNSDEDIDSIVTIPTGDLTKIVLDTNQGFTTHPSVAIGEILTYEIVFTVPAGGTMPNLTLTDILDRGLAFVDCVSITPSSANITTTLPGGFDAACDEPANPQVLTEPIGSTNQADDGRRIVFNLGTVTNGGVSDAVVRIRYQAVVLDNIENQENLALNNSVFLIWDTGALAAQATEVIIVEPALELTKTADTNIAVPGMVITFTLTVRHSALSQIDAYDVLLEDIIPTGLEYVPGSLVYVSGIAPTSIDDSAAPTLLVRWDDFPLIPGQSVIQFKATLQPLPPGASVTNEARVEWTSLPGNVLVPQSDFNLLSTERYYDPLSPVDIYGVFARFDIRVPSLPATGFAPGVVTNLPVWNDGMAYSNLGDLWLEIPALGVRMPIVGVPFNAEGWDLTWLGDQAGYLEGTAFPTSSGNTGITGHVYLPNGKPGPFVNLHTLTWGQKVIIHFNGMQYIYKVNLVQVVKPNDLTPLRHAKEPTLTLITCQGYNQQTNTYANRVAVRAVLVETRPDTLSSPGQVSPSRSIDPSRGR